MVVNQGFLGFRNRLFDRVQLLREVEAWAIFAEHLDHSLQMPVRALQSLNNVEMTLVRVGVAHFNILSS